jgi:MerR family transcriptional regulator, repressor of the yfmOP operon
MTGPSGEPTFRIGEVAERLGVTPRTIRYYQELGLLHAGSDRAKGAHRLFTEADVARLTDLMRLRDLLGLSLEELTALAEAEEARAELRGQWAETPDDAARARILEQAITHVRRQLELVEARQRTIAEVREQLETRLRELEASLAKLRRQ